MGGTEGEPRILQDGFGGVLGLGFKGLKGLRV